MMQFFNFSISDFKYVRISISVNIEDYNKVNFVTLMRLYEKIVKDKNNKILSRWTIPEYDVKINYLIAPYSPDFREYAETDADEWKLFSIEDIRQQINNMNIEHIITENHEMSYNRIYFTNIVVNDIKFRIGIMIQDEKNAINLDQSQLSDDKKILLKVKGRI